MSRAIKHGPEPCICAERAGASWSLPWTPSKPIKHGNVVRRGVVPSVTGLCFGVMAWSPPVKEPSRKSAVGLTRVVVVVVEEVVVVVIVVIVVVVEVVHVEVVVVVVVEVVVVVVVVPVVVAIVIVLVMVVVVVNPSVSPTSQVRFAKPRPATLK